MNIILGIFTGIILIILSKQVVPFYRWLSTKEIEHEGKKYRYKADYLFSTIYLHETSYPWREVYMESWYWYNSKMYHHNEKKFAIEAIKRYLHERFGEKPRFEIEDLMKYQ